MGVLLLGNFAFYILREIICIFVHNKLNFKHFLELSTIIYKGVMLRSTRWVSNLLIWCLVPLANYMNEYLVLWRGRKISMTRVTIKSHHFIVWSKLCLKCPILKLRLIYQLIIIGRKVSSWGSFEIVQIQIKEKIQQIFDLSTIQFQSFIPQASKKGFIGH